MGAPPALAIILHGKVGGARRDAPVLEGRREYHWESPRSVDNAVAAPWLLALCAAALDRHVRAANEAAYPDVDVIGHSWSPEIGHLLDALFATKRSQHEPAVALAGFACPNATSMEPISCHRTFSHLLGIQRALSLKSAHEVAMGRQYDAVLLSRWDTLWNAPFVLSTLPGWDDGTRRQAFYLPKQCTQRDGRSVPRAGPARALRHALCGGKATDFHVPSSALECAPAPRQCRSDLLPAAREYFVLDWWVLMGSSAGADALAGVSRQYGSDMARALGSDLGATSSSGGGGRSNTADGSGGLADGGPTEPLYNLQVRRQAISMGHFFLGLHLFATLARGGMPLPPSAGGGLRRRPLAQSAKGDVGNRRGSDQGGRRAGHGGATARIAAIRFTPLHPGIHFNLARDWERHACLILPPTCPHEGVCTARDLPNLSTTPAVRRADPELWPARATFRPSGGGPLRASCESNYFYCRPPSHRCAAAEAARHPMDRTAPRSLFMACSDGGAADCAVGPSGRNRVLASQSAVNRARRCAASLLHLYVDLSASAPMAERMMRAEGMRGSTFTDGALESGAIGETRDDHIERRALSALRTRASSLHAGAASDSTPRPLWACAACRQARSRSADGMGRVVGFAGAPISMQATIVRQAASHLAQSPSPEVPFPHSMRGGSSWGDCALGDAGGWWLGMATHGRTGRRGFASSVDGGDISGSSRPYHDNDGDSADGGSTRRGLGAGSDALADRAEPATECAALCQRCRRCQTMAVSAMLGLCLWQHRAWTPTSLNTSGDMASFSTVPRHALALLLPV